MKSPIFAAIVPAVALLGGLWLLGPSRASSNLQASALGPSFEDHLDDTAYQGNQAESTLVAPPTSSLSRQAMQRTTGVGSDHPSSFEGQGPPVAATASQADSHAGQLQALRWQLELAQDRIAWLEARLLPHEPETVGGTVGDWLVMVEEDQRPPLAILRGMPIVLEDYPVQLSLEEGQWVAARIELRDWSNWGPTADEAIIEYLGPERLAAELPDQALERLQETFRETDLFW